MKLFICALLLCFSANLWAQEAPKLSSELELKRQILQLQLALKSERERVAQLTIAVGACTAEVVKGVRTDTLIEDFKSAVEAANPGFAYDVETGAFTLKSKKP